MLSQRWRKRGDELKIKYWCSYQCIHRNMYLTANFQEEQLVGDKTVTTHETSQRGKNKSEDVTVTQMNIGPLAHKKSFTIE